MRRLLLILAALSLMLGAVVPAASAQDAAEATADGDVVGMNDPATGKWFLGDAEIYFGDPGDWALMGDWDGDGIDTPAAYRQSDGRIYLRNSNTQGVADRWFNFGNPNDIPIAGDFDGDGFDTISVYRPATGEVFIINELGADGGGLGAAEYSFLFGNPGDIPFTGDFDGDGIDSVGLHRPSTGEVYFRNALSTGTADSFLVYGNPGDQMFAGDWDNDGTDTLGVFRSSSGSVYLRNSNTAGVADVKVVMGAAGQRAVAGTMALDDIVDTAIKAGNFTTLIAALEKTGLDATLRGDGPFTVFAPTDEAFAKLLADLGITADQLLASPDLADILTYHVAAGRIPASEVVTLKFIETVNGQDIWIEVKDGKVILNPGTPSEAEIVVTDIEASNGVIHVIDYVLQPLDIVDTAIAAGFDTLVAALAATEGDQCAHHTYAKCPTNLVTALRGDGPFTVFAPTDEAFAKLPQGTLDALLADPYGLLSEILTYHVLAGEYDAADVVGWAETVSPVTLQGQNLWISVVDGRVFINAGTDSVAEIILTDILATNGVIHVIDAVLQPLDVVDTAIAAGFDTLVAALAATENDQYCAHHVEPPCPAKLVTALRGDGPFTVFAPTDEAFAKLLADLGIEAGELLANPDLDKILLYHVLGGEYDSADVIGWNGGTTPPTLLGPTISVDVVDNAVLLNRNTQFSAKVIGVDVFATNGVIHVINGVLIPPMAAHAG